MEKHYAFIKNNKVTLIAVFESENTEVANLIKSEHNFDSYVWLGSSEKPHLYSSYDGATFTDPTLDYLYEIGVAQENTAMYEARIAAEVEEPTND
jgi:hypothetical protein